MALVGRLKDDLSLSECLLQIDALVKSFKCLGNLLVKACHSVILLIMFNREPISDFSY